MDSAEWTDRMRSQLYGAAGADGTEYLLRCFGYGVPNVERALWSAANALTLVVQDELQPFVKDKSNEMHLHKLPWPRAALVSLGAARVELRVTLSYFIEPNPARRGWGTRTLRRLKAMLRPAEVLRLEREISERVAERDLQAQVAHVPSRVVEALVETRERALVRSRTGGRGCRVGAQCRDAGVGPAKPLLDDTVADVFALGELVRELDGALKWTIDVGGNPTDFARIVNRQSLVGILASCRPCRVRRVRLEALPIRLFRWPGSGKAGKTESGASF